MFKRHCVLVQAGSQSFLKCSLWCLGKLMSLRWYIIEKVHISYYNMVQLHPWNRRRVNPTTCPLWRVKSGPFQNSGRRGQTPCHTGKVVCATAYCGDDVDFGNGLGRVDGGIGGDGVLFSVFVSMWKWGWPSRRVCSAETFDVWVPWRLTTSRKWTIMEFPEMCQ